MVRGYFNSFFFKFCPSLVLVVHVSIIRFTKRRALYVNDVQLSLYLMQQVSKHETGRDLMMIMVSAINTPSISLISIVNFTKKPFKPQRIRALYRVPRIQFILYSTYNTYRATTIALYVGWNLWRSLLITVHIVFVNCKDWTHCSYIL